MLRTFHVSSLRALHTSNKHALTKHGKCCMQNNQFPPKSFFELQVNSNIKNLIPHVFEICMKSSSLWLVHLRAKLILEIIKF